MSLKLIVNDPRFTPLFWTQFFGALNDNFFKNGLVILVAFHGVRIGDLHPNLVVALAGGIFILPFFLFSATAGQLADKFEKSRIIRITKVCELLIMVTAATGFLLNNFPMLLGVLFLMGTQSTFFGPVKYGILPQLLDESRLVSGNAFIEMGTFLAILIGTIAGGAATLSEHFQWIMIAGLLGLSLAGILGSWFVPQVRVYSPSTRIDWTLFRPTLEILKIAHRNTGIFHSILGISWFWFLGAGLLTLFPTFVKDVLFSGEQIVTAFLALFTLGIGVGSLLCERLSFRRVEIGLVPIGSIGMSLFMADLYWVGSAWPAEGDPLKLLSLSQFIALPGGLRILIDLFMTALLGGLFIVPLYSFIQSRGDSGEISRIISGNNIINSLFMVVSALLITGFHALQVTVPQIFLFFAVVNLLVSFYIYSLVPEFTLRFISWVLIHSTVRMKVEGGEHLPENGPAVLVSNHVSFVDWLLMFGACKRPVRFVMYFKLYRIPFARILFRHGKVIPIAGAKEAPHVMNAAFDQVSQELQDGELVGIYPEGALTRDGRMNPFRPGIEKVIQRDPVPVVPMALAGLWGNLFSYREDGSIVRFPKRWRPRLILKIGKPVPPGAVSAVGLQRIVQGLLNEAESQLRG